MYTNPTLEDIIQAVDAFLNMQGYSDDTLYHYHRYGLDYFRNHFRTVEYTEQESQRLVEEARSLMDDGKLSARRFRMIRRVHEMMQMYFTKGCIQYEGARLRCIHEPCDSFLEVMNSYLAWRRNEGCSELTVRFEKSVIRNFLLYLEHSDIQFFSKIEFETVEAYLPVLKEKWSVGLSDPLCVLRSFLKYCAQTGETEMDLSGVLNVKSASKQSVKQGFSNEEIQKILSVIDRNTSLGKRNFAMITLAVHTGLRQIDVLNLKLSNIYWRESEIRIIQHKTKRQIILPLDQETGDAIADYILNVRPQVDSDFVFLRSIAPYRNLKVGSCIGSRMVQKYAVMCGVSWSKNDRKGFHSFRRSLGREMLVNEVPLYTISEVLGHASRDSAKQYMSIDVEHLRACALSLSGIECGKAVYR